MDNISKSLFPNFYFDAIDKIEKLFAQYGGIRQLKDWEISSIYQKQKQLTKGWRLNILKDGEEIVLDLLFNKDFPFVPPKVIWVNRPTFLTYPHIEEDGVLCSLTNSTSISSYSPERLIVDLVDEGLNLIETNVKEENQEDFRTEFSSYWGRLLTNKQERFISLIDPNLNSRKIVSAKINGKTFFAENIDFLKRWVENYYNKTVEKFDEAALIYISELPIPKEYPKNNRELYSYLKRNSPDGIGILHDLAKQGPNLINLLLISKCLNGKVMAGVKIYPPDLNDLTKGFRSSKGVPVNLFLTRHLLSNKKIGRYEVERMDVSWIHGRNSNLQQNVLNSAKVVLIGCGSVGSYLAKFLAVTGVGTIYLIDPETLTSANIGRHYLGAKYVGGFKAEGLQKDLSENYPHLQIEARNKTWQEVVLEEPQILAESTLIISTTGSWEAESMLNLWQNENENAPPILYGWTEAFAVAGHALTIVKSDGCLQCGRDVFGRPLFKVADFSEETLKQEPACGITFQPYGFSDLSNTISLIGQSVLDVILGKTVKSIHNIWAGRHENIIENNGKWTKEWLELSKGNKIGRIQTLKELEISDQCLVCKQTKAKTVANRGV